MVKLTRTIHQPQGLPEAKMEGFFLLSPAASAIAINERLTGTQFRLWHYLMAIDSFADQTSDGERIYHNIPTPVEIATAIGCSPRTVEKDMRRLEDIGLYASRVIQWQGYNLSAQEGKAAAEAAKQKQRERRAKAAKVLRRKDGYLAANPVKPPPTAQNNRDLDKIAKDETAVTLPDEGLQAAAILPQIIQTSTNDSEFVEVLEQEASAPLGGAAPLVQEVEEEITVSSVPPTNTWELRSQFEAIEKGIAPPDAALLAQCYENDPGLSVVIARLLLNHPEWNLKIFNGSVVSVDQIKAVDPDPAKRSWFESGKMLKEKILQRKFGAANEKDKLS